MEESGRIMKRLPFDAALYTKKIAAKNLKAGDILAYDVYLKNGLLVAPAGIELNENQIRKLLQLGEKAVTLDLRQVYKKGVQASRKLFSEARDNKPITARSVDELIRPFQEELKRETNIARLLYSLQSKDEYTFQHTINIGMISMALGRWLGYSGNELHDLTVAGTLHDIGKSKVPNEVLNKPASLNAKEMSIIRNHPIEGYEIVKKSSGFSEAVGLAVLQHHERMDGKGYPFKLPGDKVHVFARIVAVADIYHAMTTTRVYKNKVNPFLALEQLQQSIAALDPQITLTFIEKMLATLQGCQVILSNKQRGDIIYVDRQHLAYPLVKIQDNNTLVDLRQRKDLSIADMVYPFE